MRRFLLPAVLLLLVVTPLHSAPRHVVMISIDGLKGITLASLPKRQIHTPNLNEFVEAGALADGLIGVFPTVTYPSHTTLVAGVAPSEHGILGNTLFDPEHQLNGAWYYYAEQIKVPTLWTIARTAGIQTAAVSWPVTVGAAIDADIPEYRPARTYEDVMQLRAVSTPGLVAEYEKTEGVIEADRIDDHARSAMAAYLVRTRKPGLLLVHLIEMDHEEHLHGPDSPEALQALERIDEGIGTIRKAVRDAGLESQTVFVIVSDHGFFAVDKSFHPSVVLNGLGLLGQPGHTDQWRVGVFGNGSSFGLVAHDPHDQEAIELARKAFHDLAKDDRWGIDKIYEGADLRQSGGYSNAFLAVSLKSNFSVGGGADGPWVTSSGNTRGMHGYAPGPVELDASFVAFGPGIAHKNLGRHHLVDVAPTIADLLGLPMPGVQGTSLIPGH